MTLRHSNGQPDRGSKEVRPDGSGARWRPRGGPDGNRGETTDVVSEIETQN